MNIYHDAKEMLKRELSEIVKKGELSAGSLETIDKLLNSIKNACKITMYEEFGDDGYSNAVRRDSMGRYSRTGMMHDDGYARRGYSYDDGRKEKAEILREMMRDSSSEEERKVISRLIRKMEND